MKKIILAIMLFGLVSCGDSALKGRGDRTPIKAPDNTKELCNENYDKFWKDGKCADYRAFKSEHPYIKGEDASTVLPIYYQALFKLWKEGKTLKKRILFISFETTTDEKILEDILFLNCFGPITIDRFLKVLENNNYIVESK